MSECTHCWASSACVCFDFCGVYCLIRYAIAILYCLSLWVVLWKCKPAVPNKDFFSSLSSWEKIKSVGFSAYPGIFLSVLKFKLQLWQNNWEEKKSYIPYFQKVIIVKPMWIYFHSYTTHGAHDHNLQLVGYVSSLRHCGNNVMFSEKVQA